MVEVSRPGIWVSVLFKSGRSKAIEIQIHATGNANAQWPWCFMDAGIEDNGMARGCGT